MYLEKRRSRSKSPRLRQAVTSSKALDESALAACRSTNAESSGDRKRLNLRLIWRLLRASRSDRLKLLLEDYGINCKLRLPNGNDVLIGCEPYEFEIVVNSWRALRHFPTELSIGNAYVEGELDIQGNMYSAIDARLAFTELPSLGGSLTKWADLFLRRPTVVNKGAIDSHYSLGDDFYHLFIDKKHRFYSHGLFEQGTTTIEEASENKLDRMYQALSLKAGMHILDIGAGWGPVTRYCCERGLRVTSLTIAEDSKRYIDQLISENGYDANVLVEDFLIHNPATPYDAIVIYGVIEHIPRYRLFVERAWSCLAPGGRMYLDGSASLEKYNTSKFTKKYIWPGTHAFLFLPDLLREFLYGGFKIVEVRNESFDYHLTMKEWATRFEANRLNIVERWGEDVYRAFRVYLWGGCRSLATNDLQAYSLVAERTSTPGPRPSFFRRASSFLASLA